MEIFSEKLTGFVMGSLFGDDLGLFIREFLGDDTGGIFDRLLDLFGDRADDILGALDNFLGINLSDVLDGFLVNMGDRIHDFIDDNLSDLISGFFSFFGSPEQQTE